MKECVIVAASKYRTSTAACEKLDRMGFIAGESRGGFHPYYGAKIAMPDIMVIDLAALDPAQLAQKLCDLRKEHHLTLMCATMQDQYRVKRMIRDHPVRHSA